MAQLKLSDITNDTIASIAEHLEDRYIFFTENGIVSIGPDHPQFAQAEAEYRRRLEDMFRESE